MLQSFFATNCAVSSRVRQITDAETRLSCADTARLEAVRRRLIDVYRGTQSSDRILRFSILTETRIE